MVPKLHAKGTSFKGLAAYLLHDKERAKTADRVAWVETRNLITDDPDTAWRVMAATAMDQDRLKALAGVKNTGRKSKDSVLHLTLAWHPTEKNGLTKEEMLRSAHAAIRAIEAGDRQAMIICHDDEVHPHIHILINRVSPEDGRMLSSSKEKLNLSQWAEKYEKERGQVFCEERVLNNDARKRGHFKRGQKDQARHIYEQAPANDNSPKTQAIRKEQRAKDAVVAKSARATKERHRIQWQAIQDRFRQRTSAIRAQHLLNVTRAKEAVRTRFRSDYQMLFHEQQAEQAQFLKNEKSLMGRVFNALKTIDFKALVGGQSIEPDRRQTLGQAFDALSSAGARLEQLKQRQARQSRELETKEKNAEKEAGREQRVNRDQELKKCRGEFTQERNDLILSQKLESAKHRTDWKTRNEQRDRAWENTAPPPDGKSLERDRQMELSERLREIREFGKRMAEKEKDQDHTHDRDD